MKCPICNREIKGGQAKFCPYCGNVIQHFIICQSCGQTNIPSSAKFCPKCGISFEKKNNLNHRLDNMPIAEYGECINLGTKNAVDLGLRVLWSSHNVGAQSVLYPGIEFSWGDPSRETITSKWAYWTKHAPYESDICGHIKYDMAKFHWGGGWRLPSCDDFLELKESCSWNIVAYQNQDFYQVKSRINGNYILFPINIRLWAGDRAYGGTVHFFDTYENELCTELFDIDHIFYVRPVIEK